MGSDRVEGTYLTLRSLGAPEISQDDFSRLCQGPLGEVLQFFADHVKGRQEVSRIRANIAQTRIFPSAAAPGRNVDVSYNRYKSATARLKNSSSILQDAKQRLKERQLEVSDLQKEVDQHQRHIARQRLARLLLMTLEARENIRLQRFHALAVLLEKLRFGISQPYQDSSQEDRTVLENPSQPGNRPRTPIRRIRADYARDVLAALHAYSLALHQDSPQVDITQLETSENRLRQAVVKSLNTIREDSQMKVVYEECCRTARKRAVQGPRFISPLPTRNVNELELDDLSGRVTEKEQRLQAISDKTIELIEACERHLKEMEKFVEETIPQLQRLLEKAVDDTTGYVDILRLSITDRLKDAPQTEADKVIHCRGKTPGKTVHDVKEALVRAHEIREFLRKAQLKDPSPSDKCTNTDDINALIATFSETQGRVDERITLLLSRKIEKARAAEVLVADIDRLADEVKMLCSSQTFLGL